MLYLFGRGEVAISVSGDPDDASRLTHTVRSVGSVTHGFDNLSEGQSIGVRGPFGTAWPVEEIKGRDVLFLAGGLGLAPLRPAILHVLAQPRAITARFAFSTARATPRCCCSATISNAGRLRRVSIWTSPWTMPMRSGTAAVGVITKLIARAEIDPDKTAALICGPEIMMHFAVEGLKARGMASEQIYVSLERNMKCALGHCGHCQLGPAFICRDGPVFRHDRAAPLLRVAGL